MPNKKKARDSSDPIFLFISLRPISSFTHLKWKQIVTKSHIAVPWVHSPHPQISIRHWRPFVQYSDPPRTTPWGGFLVVWWCPGLEERKKAEDIEDRSWNKQMFWKFFDKSYHDMSDFFGMFVLGGFQLSKMSTKKSIWLIIRVVMVTEIKQQETLDVTISCADIWHISFTSLSKPWASWKSTAGLALRWEGVYMLLSGIDQIWHQIWSVRIFIGLAKC